MTERFDVRDPNIPGMTAVYHHSPGYIRGEYFRDGREISPSEFYAARWEALRDRLEAIRLAQRRLRGLPLELPEEVG